MADLTMLQLHKTVPGAGQWMGKALERVTEKCNDDPNAETDGRELAEHLMESFQLDPEKARYLFIVGINGTEIRGHIIARIDVGYENRRQCWIGFFALDRGYRWDGIVSEGLDTIETWAKARGCHEILISVYSQSHARLYRLPRYGGLKVRNLVLSRRIEE